jgi:hypothetical protein
VEPNEIVKLYDHVLIQSGRKHDARTVVAGMMISATRRARDGKAAFFLGREDGDRPWHISFRLQVLEKHAPSGFGKSTMIMMIRHAKNQPETIACDNYAFYTPVILSYGGDYEAYRSDFTLLRMFSHEWFDA